jgi:hypothetical protein
MNYECLLKNFIRGEMDEKPARLCVRLFKRLFLYFSITKFNFNCFDLKYEKRRGFDAGKFDNLGR